MRCIGLAILCGISGKVHFDQARPADRTLIARMNTVQCHRGPDDEAVWSDGPVALGQRRLAIIDRTPTGNQPMSNEDGSIWITFNGEIYNHLELRADLERRGHRYRGRSDTETILHLYEEYGRDCARQLRGMFAFALWDGRQRCLLLARDRVGKKPLVYAETADGLTFASEIKALLQDEAVSREIDFAGLHRYLTYGFVPGPGTGFRHICKLPPGTTLLWQDGRVSIERYWTLSYTPKLVLSEEEAAIELLAQMREATQIRLMSEVPLGAFLSGGIDSSSVVALMAEASSRPVKTFAIGFEDASYDELAYARQVAERYGTEHHEFAVSPEALAVLPELAWAYGEPYGDSSALPTYYLAKLTRQHVTVALNGDGGDEAFGGYDRYVATRLSGRYQRLPGWLRHRVLVPVARRLPEPVSYRSALRRAKHFILAQTGRPESRYGRWLTLMEDETKNKLYTADFREQIGNDDALALLDGLIAAADSPDFVERAQFADVMMYLPDDLLVKVDIASMAHSLEARSPFLDHKLLEFAARLPAEYKLRGGTGKHILRRAMRPYLPVAILNRRKQGFALPIGRWLRHELRQAAYDLLLDARTLGRGLFDRQAVHSLLDEHSKGRANHRYPIWELITLELWFRTYIDRPRSALTGPVADIR